MVNILTNELMFFSSWMGSVPCAVSQLGCRASGETPCGLAETRNNLLSFFLNSCYSKAQTSGKIRDFTEMYRGFPGGSGVKNLPIRRHRFDPWVWKTPWRRKWQPTPVFLPGEPHAQRSLAGSSPWGRKSQTQLSDETTTTNKL